MKERAWTAALEQTGDFAALPLAVIMDIDETVLDNARYQAQLVIDQTDFNPNTWDHWISLKAAAAIPGAVDFIKALNERDVEVFYITNRECRPRKGNSSACPQEQDTIDNLAKVGIAGVAPDNIMLKNEQRHWPSEKRRRREAVAARFRILMLFGDDLGDFLPDVKKDITPRQRKVLVRRYAGHWGRKWYILSNPAYGSWLRVLVAPKAQYLKGY